MPTKFKSKTSRSSKNGASRGKSAKIRVGLIFGGKSSEHSISCLTAANVLQEIDRNKYDVFAIGITKSGTWLRVSDDPMKWGKSGRKLPEVKEANMLVKRPFRKPIEVTLASGGLDLDVVFPLLHGKYGEDGTIQGLLEMLEMPYVGCSVLASSVCHDKHFTKILAQAAGIKVAPWVLVNVELDKNGRLPKNFVLEDSILEQIHALKDVHHKVLFVKPSRSGSSVGVSKITKQSELLTAIEKAAREDSKVLIEQGVNGREIECAVLGSRYSSDQLLPSASTLGEIITDEFYDYNSKYLAKKSELIVNPVMDDECAKRLKNTAITAFKALECQGLARVDMFLTARGEVYLNEINTMPGFTAISMYPKLKEADGLSYSDLIDTLIQLATSENIGRYNERAR